MIATFESFDEILAEVTRQATRNATIASDSTRHYVGGVTAANNYQLASLGSLHQAVFRSAFDLQSASFQFSRSVLDAASLLNRAVVRWAATAIWPWEPLGPLTEPAAVASQQETPTPEVDHDPSQAGDYAMSALRFLGPMGDISSGMGEVGQS